MTISEAVFHFHAKKAGKGKYTAKCPCHVDKSKNTLSLREGKKGVLVKCWAGCPTVDVVKAAGVRMTDLFYHSRDVSSESLKKIRRQQVIDCAYDAEKRCQDLQMMLKAVNLKPYQRCKRTRSTFDILVEKAIR